MGESPPLNGDLDAELWSSPLMHYTSPFDDYKDLFDQIPKDTNVFQFPDTAAKPTSGPTKLPVPQRSPTLPTSPLCQDTTPCKCAKVADPMTNGSGLVWKKLQMIYVDTLCRLLDKDSKENRLTFFGAFYLFC